MDTTAILKYANEWRHDHGVTDAGPLTAQQTAEFALGLHDEIKKFSVRPERDGTPEPGQFAQWAPDATAIPYSGNAGGVQGWKLASAMSANGEGRLFYISDTPAGRLLNESDLRTACHDCRWYG